MLARSFALFLGAFIAVGLLDWLRRPSFDPNIWWIDLGFLPAPLAQALLAVSGLLLLAFVWRPAVRGWRGWATTATCATAATVRDTVPMLRSHDLRQVIAVSDFYHLPRVKLAYASAGLDVLTVPAVGGEWIAKTPYLIVRDDAGFWVYLLRETI